jgi:hypothetical protein
VAFFAFLEKELLRSRSGGRSCRLSSRSCFFLLGFLCFFCVLCFLGFFVLLNRSFFSSRSSLVGRSSSRSSLISSENNTSESNSNESSNDGGQNFFHL